MVRAGVKKANPVQKNSRLKIVLLKGNGPIIIKSEMMEALKAAEGKPVRDDRFTGKAEEARVRERKLSSVSPMLFC